MSLQSEKWDAKRQLADATKILLTLIKVREHFQERVTQVDKSLVVQQRAHKGAAILRLGEHAPDWMQRLGRDALAKYFFLFNGYDFIKIRPISGNADNQCR